MKRNKKLLILVSVMTILAVGLFSTLAYLTDQESVTNTFTVGQVDIALDETLVDENGNPVDEDGDGIPDKTEEGNDYHLVPGQTYLKDPTVTVAKGSEESYVRMIMTVHNASAVQAIIDGHDELTDFSAFLKGWNKNVWQYVGYTEDTTANTISFEFRYHKTVSGFNEDGSALADDLQLEPLFTHLFVPGVITGEEIAALYGDLTDEKGDFKIAVEGHAIQAVGFDDADAAWAAFGDQNTSAAKGATVK